MKKIIAIITVSICLCGLLGVTAFAADAKKYDFNGYILPDITGMAEYVLYDYVYIMEDGGRKFATFTLSVPTFNENNVFLDKGPIICYKLVGENWEFYTTYENGYSLPDYTLIWSSVDIKDASSKVAFPATSFVEYIENVKAKDFIEVVMEAGKQFSVNAAVGVLVFIATAVVALPFMWWGVRKLTRALMTAFRKGKISV